jgi:hypothetical protein
VSPTSRPKKESNDKKKIFSDIWKKFQEQEDMISQQPETENTLTKHFRSALLKMIDSFKRALHIKMIVIQIDHNLKNVRDDLASEDKVKDIDFEVTQQNFNKHYDDCYQKLNVANISPAKSKNRKQQKTEFETEGNEVNENSFLAHQYS